MPCILHTSPAPTYLVHRTTFSPVELTLLLLAQTVASVAFGCGSPAGPLPWVPLSLARTPLGILEEVSEVSIPDEEDSRTGDILFAVFTAALPASNQLSGVSDLSDTCLLPTSLVLEETGLRKEAGGSTVPGHFSVSEASQAGMEASGSPTASWSSPSFCCPGDACGQERTSCAAWLLLTVQSAAPVPEES